jgi:hypothetical protein
MPSCTMLQHPPTPCSLLGQRHNAQTGSERLERRCRQAFGHHVRVLLAGGYMKNSEFAKLDTLSNKMYVQLYMFGAFVVNRVS